MAGARLTIVCTDDELLRRAENLTETGKQLWHTAQDDSEEEWYDAMERHRRGLADFVTRASVAARNGSTI
jgi:allantoicase